MGADPDPNFIKLKSNSPQIVDWIHKLTVIQIRMDLGSGLRYKDLIYFIKYFFNIQNLNELIARKRYFVRLILQYQLARNA